MFLHRFVCIRCHSSFLIVSIHPVFAFSWTLRSVSTPHYVVLSRIPTFHMASVPMTQGIAILLAGSSSPCVSQVVEPRACAMICGRPFPASISLNRHPPCHSALCERNASQRRIRVAVAAWPNLMGSARCYRLHVDVTPFAYLCALVCVLLCVINLVRMCSTS